jgi:hypothetical protein
MSNLFVETVAFLCLWLIILTITVIVTAIFGSLLLVFFIPYFFVEDQVLGIILSYVISSAIISLFIVFVTFLRGEM